MADKIALEELRLRKKLRKKWSATFHKNMDVKTIASQWNKAVLANPGIVLANPIIAGTITGISTAISTAEIANAAKAVATKAVDTKKQIVTVAGSILPTIASTPPAPNPNFEPTLLPATIQEEVAEQSEQIAATAIGTIGDTAIDLLVMPSPV